MVAGIECPTRVIYADPAHRIFPTRTRERAALAFRVASCWSEGGHHFKEQPAAVAVSDGDFILRIS